VRPRTRSKAATNVKITAVTIAVIALVELLRGLIRVLNPGRRGFQSR